GGWGDAGGEAGEDRGAGPRGRPFRLVAAAAYCLAPRQQDRGYTPTRPPAEGLACGRQDRCRGEGDDERRGPVLADEPRSGDRLSLPGELASFDGGAQRGDRGRR